jgi:hypothetical protein
MWLVYVLPHDPEPSQIKKAHQTLVRWDLFMRVVKAVDQGQPAAHLLFKRDGRDRKILIVRRTHPAGQDAGPWAP